MTTDTTWDPKPWAIDPEHGRARGPGYLGDAYHSLRVRELFRYYQPPTQEELRHLAPINTGGDYVKQAGLISSPDPILAALANLTTRVMDMRRCIVSMTGAGTSYVIAESTRTLSLQYPHTHDPDDAPMMGGGVATSSLGGLCEHTCSLLPPPPGSSEAFLLEIPDLSKHPKFCNVGYVRGWPHARFYCGAPIRTKNGVTIGTVCVMDEHARYNGLTEIERMNMSNMAELFMKYFETKEGDQFRKTGQMMETELSRFIAEGFLPSAGTEITERRNGKLWSESILESRRRSEEERREMVAEKRQTLQEMEYSKMMMGQQSRPASLPGQYDCSSAAPGSEYNRSLEASQTSQAHQGNLISTICDLSGLDLNRDASSSQASASSPVQKPILDNTATTEEPQVEEYLPIVHPLQPGIIEMVPAALADERKSLLATVGTVLLGGPSELQERKGMVERLQDDSSVASTNLFRNNSDVYTTPDTQFDSVVSPFGETGPETHASSSVSGTIGSSSEDFPSITAATSLQSQMGQRKRSKYEETTSVEPHFRAMFARASSVIKNTIDCDVVFVDGDLEGFFEPELAEEDPYVAEEWGWSHVSSDDKNVSELRAKKPKQHRQKSGILGYATSKGSSSARFDGPKKITDLGFDMSELNEALLDFLLKDCEKGKIFSFFDEYPGLEEHEDPEELECKKVLQKFLPGCRSVIVVPLYDHNQELSAACFAWTCSDQKTFYGDKEGRFVSGVASSVMNEMARIQILSADKAKSEFISSISHELRSPLHGILASAEFLIDGQLRPDQRSFVETIISCGTTLLDTVNHVLDFQKLNFFKDEKIGRDEAPPSPTADLEAIKEEHSHSPSGSSTTAGSEESLFNTNLVSTDFSTILQEVTEGVVLGYEFKDLSKIFGQPEDVKKAALTAPSKVSKVQVIIDIEEREAGWVFLSNPAAIKRIVGNLVGNAIKYSHESGWIKITLAARSMEPASNGAPRAKIVLIVSDSGKGMSREFLKTRLFTPFTQENPMASGAGLGLSIVRQLVEMLDGTIDVKSQLGKGTTFRVEMRLTQQMPGDVTKSDRESDSVLSRTSGRKALFVGFERFDTPDTAEQRAQSLLYDSFTRYARDLFHMEAVFDPSAPGASDCQVIVVNEMSAAATLHELSILKDRPVVLLCNSTPRRSVLKDFNFDRDPRYFTFMRKPCGPKKLMRAFQFCFDVLENGLPSPPAAKDERNQPAPVSSLLEPGADPAVAVQSSLKGVQIASLDSFSVVPLVSPQLSPHSQNQTISFGPGAAQQPQLGNTFQSSVEAGASSPTAFATVSGTEYPLPLQRPAPTPLPATLSPVASQTPSKVDGTPRQPNLLCVEDNRINMVLLTTYLKKKKYPLKMACDGAEAVERYKEEVASGGFHCILMDLQMPIMSGIEATREIRALEAKHPEKYKRTFIIALTGLAAGSDRREAFSAGVDAFMVKPVSFKDLEKILDEHVRNGIMLADDSTPETERKRNSIVSMESSRGKAIEIKRQITGEKTLAMTTLESVENNIKAEAGT